MLGWRDVPVDDAFVGVMAGAAAPRIRQVFVGAGDELPDQLAFERKLYVIRRLIEKAAGPELAIPSFSSRTVVYKGMLTAPQMSGYYPDLKDERMVDAPGARALALLDEHVPELGAGASRTGCSPTTARSTRCAATSTGCARASRSSLSEHFGDDLAEAHAGRAPRRLGLGDVRQRARAARARRPPDHARRDDDGAGGLPRQRGPVAGRARLLRLPLVRDGAVGRPRRDLPSPTARRSARRSTATGCARVAGSRPSTATSCSRPRPA